MSARWAETKINIHTVKPHYQDIHPMGKRMRRIDGICPSLVEILLRAASKHGFGTVTALV